MKMLMDYAEVVRTCGPVPPNVYEAVKRYVEQGIEPGGFVRACLENNLQMAVTRADDKNKEYLQSICWMLTSAVPSVSVGSESKVRAWLDGGHTHANVFKEIYSEPVQRAD